MSFFSPLVSMTPIGLRQTFGVGADVCLFVHRFGCGVGRAGRGQCPGGSTSAQHAALR